MGSYGLIWTHMDSYGLILTHMESAEVLQPLSASDLSLSLLILELWVQWTPLDSFGLFSHTWSVTLSKTLTPMNSNGLSWTRAASDLACVYSSWNFDSNELLYTPVGFSLRLGSLLFLKLWLIWTPMDSPELFQSLSACDLSLSHPTTLTPMISYWLLWGFLSGLVHSSF